MKGRQENDRKIEESILTTLKSSYPILSDYYYSLIDKTPSTKRQYINRVKEFLDFLQFDNNIQSLKEIKPSDINKYMESIRYKDDGTEKSTSIRAVSLFAVNKFFDFLQNEGYINENICNKIKPPKSTEEKEVVAMTVDEIHEVENNIMKLGGKWKSRDLAIFILGCTIGLRVSSITEIDINDIDFESNKIIVTEKGNKTRTCTIGNKTIECIKNWMVDRQKILGDISLNALFISSQKKRMSAATIRRSLGKYTYSLNKKITPHKMRSTCATTLYDATGDIYLVQDILGHKNIANTRRYAKMSEEKRNKAAEIMNNIVSN